MEKKNIHWVDGGAVTKKLGEGGISGGKGASDMADSGDSTKMQGDLQRGATNNAGPSGATKLLERRVEAGSKYRRRRASTGNIEKKQGEGGKTKKKHHE